MADKVIQYKVEIDQTDLVSLSRNAKQAAKDLRLQEARDSLARLRGEFNATSLSASKLTTVVRGFSTGGVNGGLVSLAQVAPRIGGSVMELISQLYLLKKAFEAGWAAGTYVFDRFVGSVQRAADATGKAVNEMYASMRKASADAFEQMEKVRNIEAEAGKKEADREKKAIRNAERGYGVELPSRSAEVEADLKAKSAEVIRLSQDLQKLKDEQSRTTAAAVSATQRQTPDAWQLSKHAREVTERVTALTKQLREAQEAANDLYQEWLAEEQVRQRVEKAAGGSGLERQSREAEEFAAQSQAEFEARQQKIAETRKNAREAEADYRYSQLSPEEKLKAKSREIAQYERAARAEPDALKRAGMAERYYRELLPELANLQKQVDDAAKARAERVREARAGLAAAQAPRRMGAGIEGYFQRMYDLKAGRAPQDDAALQSLEILRQIAAYNAIIAQNSGVAQ